MRLSPESDGPWNRFVLAIGGSLAGTLVVILGMLAPELELFLPAPVRSHRIAILLAGLAAVYGVARVAAGRARSRTFANDPFGWMVDRADVAAGVALSGGLSILFSGVCLAYLATWLPHYLLWPWGRDADTFATLAQSWDQGIRPYREIRGYNFPGAIYLFWLLGKTFGWGRTWALYAFDASALILFGVIAIAWSRRCLGRMLPGLVSSFLFLTYYLHLDFTMVAQRDWHTSVFVVLALMLLQGWPGIRTRVVSAVLCACAMAIRPHAVFFLPALASAVLEGTAQSDLRPLPDRRLQRRRLAEWFLMLGLFTALLFSPLVLAGIADDLMRGLRIAAYGGPYSQASLATAKEVLEAQLLQSATSIPAALLALLLVTARGTARRRVVTWSLALLAALSYRLFHPVQHRYLAYPLALVDACALAMPIAWIVDQRMVSPFLRVICVFFLIGEVGLGIPMYCDASRSVDALVTIARGQDIPLQAPPGSGGWFDTRKARLYHWDDYRATLIYLRATTSPGTLVANVLRAPPYPAINGPTGRLSPFRAESGVCWMLLVTLDLEPEFEAALERATDSVVVWSPEEPVLELRMRFDVLAAVIRRLYRPEARFGRFEVWRRADAAR
jgi:hypothetical protein